MELLGTYMLHLIVMFILVPATFTADPRNIAVSSDTSNFHFTCSYQKKRVAINSEDIIYSDTLEESYKEEYQVEGNTFKFIKEASTYTKAEVFDCQDFSLVSALRYRATFAVLGKY